MVIPVKKTFIALGIIFLALTGMVLGFVGKRAVEASRFENPVEFLPLTFVAPSSQAGAFGQGGGACKQ